MLNKLRGFLRNELGLSMVQGMVLAGIVAGGALVTTKLMVEQKQAMKSAETRDQIEDVHNLITGFLKDKDNCRQTMVEHGLHITLGDSVVSHDITKISGKDSGNIIATVGGTYLTNNVLIQSMTLKSPTEGKRDLEILYERLDESETKRTKRGMGAKHIRKSIPLRIQKSAAGDFEYCYVVSDSTEDKANDTNSLNKSGEDLSKQMCEEMVSGATDPAFYWDESRSLCVPNTKCPGDKIYAGIDEQGNRICKNIKDWVNFGEILSTDSTECPTDSLVGFQIDGANKQVKVNCTITNDTTPPSIVSFSPAAGKRISPPTQVLVTFSELMTPETVTNAANWSMTCTNGGSYSVSSVTLSGLVATVNLSGSMPTSGTCTFIASSAITDKFNNALVGGLQVIYDIDKIPPTITSRTPASNSTNVAINTFATVTFSEAMNPATITNSTFTISGRSASVSYNASTNTATLIPSSNLSYSTTYTVTVSGSITDVAGNAVAASSWSFTTEQEPDTTAPLISSFSPLAQVLAISNMPMQIIANFSEAMKANTVTTAGNWSVACTGGGSFTVSSVTLSGQVASINLSGSKTTAGSCTLTASTAIQDLAGNALGGIRTVTYTFGVEIALYTSTRYYSDGTFARTCKEYLTPPSLSVYSYSGSTGNGTYRIDPDGAGSIAPLDVECDMASGGWTGLNAISTSAINAGESADFVTNSTVFNALASLHSSQKLTYAHTFTNGSISSPGTCSRGITVSNSHNIYVHTINSSGACCTHYWWGNPYSWYCPVSGTNCLNWSVYSANNTFTSHPTEYGMYPTSAETYVADNGNLGCSQPAPVTTACTYNGIDFKTSSGTVIGSLASNAATSGSVTIPISSGNGARKFNTKSSCANNSNVNGSITFNGLVYFGPPSPSAPVISYVGATGTTVAANASMNVNPTTLTNNGGAITNCTSSPALPTGITINANTCKISGISTVAVATATYTITATNSAGSGTATVQLTVTPPPPTISYAASTGTTRNIGVAMSVTPSTLNANGGTISSCTILPALPSPLGINNTTCVISGTPSALLSETNYTVTATNGGGSSVASVTLRVNAGVPSVSYSGSSGTTVMVNSLMSVIPSVSSNGQDVSNCTASPNLPAGLSISPTSCIISGIPTVVTPTTTYTVTVTNTVGSNTGPVALTVNPPPPLISYTGATGTTGTRNAFMSVSPTTLNPSGGTISSCTISPNLPNGLSIHNTTCVISGTPTVISPNTTYTVTVSNGSTATATVDLSVGATNVKNFGAYRGWADGSYADSCSSYRNPPNGFRYEGDTGDGIYRIDVDDSGALTAFDVKCDMTTDGGGWTVLIAHDGNYQTTTSILSNYASFSSITSGILFDANKGVYWNSSTWGKNVNNTLNFTKVVPANQASITFSGVYGNNGLGGLNLFTTAGSNAFEFTDPMAQSTYGQYLWINGVQELFPKNAVDGIGSLTDLTNNPRSFSISAPIKEVSNYYYPGYANNQRFIREFKVRTTTNIKNFGTYRGWSDGTFAKTCYHYKFPTSKFSYSGDTGDGIYRIDVDGSGAMAPFDVLCDMTTGNGGWTNVNYNFGTTVALTANNGITTSGVSTQAINGSTLSLAGTGNCVNTDTISAFTDAFITLMPSIQVLMDVKSFASGDIRCGGASYSITNTNRVKYTTFNDGALSRCDNDAWYGIGGYGFSQETSQADHKYSFDLAANQKNFASLSAKCGWGTVYLKLNKVSFRVKPALPAISYTGATGTTGTVGSIMSVTPTTLDNNGSSIVNCTTSPALPAGLSINSSTCVISGVPSAALSSTSYTVTVTNATGSSTATVSLTISAVAPSISYSGATGTTGAVGSAMSISPTSLTDGGATISSCTSSPSLPSGLIVTAPGCVISGTPTVPISSGTYTISATNSAGSGTGSVVINVNAQKPSLSYSGSGGTTGIIENPMSITPSVFNDNGAAISSCTISPGLPAGLSLHNTTCVISGTPTEAKSSTAYTVSVTNSVGTTTASVTLTVYTPPTISYASSTGTSGTVGSLMTVTPSTLNNNGSAISSCTILPALPSPLQISNTTCVISGTPSATLSLTTYTVTATNAGGSSTATVTLSVVGVPPVISYPSSRVGGNVGLLMSVAPSTLTSTSAITSCTISPALPSPLTINNTTCVISGTPSNTLSQTSYTVTATNNVGSTNASVSLIIENPVTSGLIAYLDAGNVSSFTGTGTSWLSLINSITGTLNNGPTFNTSNISGGTILQGNFTLDGTNDDTSLTDTRLWQGLTTISFEIWFQVGITSTRQGLFSTHHCTASVGCSGSNMDAVDFEIGSSNSSFFGFRSTNGSFYSANYNTPLSLNTWHQMVGTLDGSTIRYYLNGAQVATGPWPGGSVATPSGGSLFIGRYAWFYLNGKVALFRAYNRALTSNEVTQNFLAHRLRFGLNAAPTISYNLASGTTGTFGTPMSVLPTTLNGNGASVTNCTSSPTLPSGLTINPTTCEISGTPSVAVSTTTYTITATNSAGNGTGTVSLTINPATPVISYANTTGTVGVALSVTPTLNTRGASITNCTISPALPSLLALDPTSCVISGTPSSTLSTTSYTITATNSAGNGTGTISLTINSNTPVVTFSSTYTGTVSTALSITPTINNRGAAVTSCSITPALPGTLTLNNLTCAITGTPSAVLSETLYTVRASNSVGQGPASTFNLTINADRPVVNYSASYTGTVGSALTITPTITNNGASVSECSASPALPSPLTINSTTCQITGTPTSALGATTYSVSLRNSAGWNTPAASFSLTINGIAPTISYSGSTGTTGAVGDPMSVTPTTLNNGGLTITACTSSPALPSGLSVTHPGCVISGTPTATSVATNYTITATNSAGSATATLSLTVNARTPFINLNAGNTSSYPGTGTSWTSLTNSWVATMTNGASYTSSAGGGISFDGVDDFALITPTRAYRPYGLEFWIKTNCNILANETAACGPPGYSYQSLIGYSSYPIGINLGAWTSIISNEVIHINSNTAYTYTNQQLNTGLYHLFVNWNGSSYDIWLNGVKQTSIASTQGHSALLASTTSSIWLGATANQTNAYNFWGNIHEFRLWNSQVPDSEVTAQFNSTSARYKPTLSYPAITSTVGSLIETTPTLDNKGSPITNCTISPALPSPLTISTSNCMISGTPTSTLVATTYAVTATNAIGTGSATVTITVNSGTPVLTFLSSYSGTVGTALTITPTINNRGAAVTSCSITPALPGTLTLDNTTCAITGTPSAVLSETQYTVRATNSVGQGPAATFYLSVNAGRPVVTYSASYTGTVGTALTITPTVTTNGSSVFECSTSPALPASLTMSQTTCAITGTPTAVLSNTSYTVTARNGAGTNTQSSTFSLSIAAGVPVISFASSSGMNGYLNTLMSVTPSTLDNRGSTITACTSTPSLPSYLTMTAPNCVITGTPTSTLTSTAYSITATNSAGTSAATSVTLSVTIPNVVNNGTYRSWANGAFADSCQSYRNPSASFSYTGATGDGVYRIDADGAGAMTPFDALCDMTTEGGGWTVFQRRSSSAQSFYQTWASYVAGFGSASGDYWLGNDRINYMTSTARVMRVDISRTNGNTAHAKYSSFRINNSVSKYSLAVSGYSGTAGDSMAYHSGQNFSTYDSDNDVYSGNCAAAYYGGWWYGACHHSNLNGLYGTNSAAGVVWYHYVTAHNESLSTSKMMIRPHLTPTLSYSGSTGTSGISGTSMTVTPTTSNNEATSCSSSPSLPAGLSLSVPNCVISGTPSSFLASTSYTITATNPTGSTTANVTLSVIAKPVLSYSASYTGIVGTTLNITPSITTNGSAVTSCTISPQPPSPLVFNSPACTITGTPSATLVATTYSVTATNGAGTSTAVTFTLTNIAKPTLSYSSATGTQNSPMSVSPASINNNGSAITSCAPVTALPAGLSVSSPGCVISGTPTVTITATAYTIRATNSAGSTDASVTLTINPGIKNISQFSGYRGWSDNTFAVSCSEYRNPTAALYQYSGSTGDGIYRIDVDGSGALTPFDVKCDMTSDGGGWTVLIAHDGTYQTTTSILSTYATYGSVSSGIQYNATYGVFWNSSTWGKNANNTLTFSKIFPADQVRITFTGVYGNSGLGGLVLYTNDGTAVFNFNDGMADNSWGHGVYINGVQTLLPLNGPSGTSFTNAYNETRTFSITSPLKEISNYYYPGYTNNQRYIRELKVRSSTTATIVNNGTYRSWSNGTFARTCSEYLRPSAGYEYSGSTGDGVYRIDPDGAGAIAAADVTCEMSTGGWTVIKPTNPNGYNSTSYDTATSTSIHCNGYIGCVGYAGSGTWGTGVTHYYSGSGINVVFTMTSSFAAAVYNLSNSRQVKWWIFGGNGHTGCTLNFAGTSYAGGDRYVTTSAFGSATSYSFSASTSCSGTPYFYYVTSELRYNNIPTCATNTTPGTSCSEGGFYLGTSGGFKYMTTAVANEYPGGGHWPNAVSHCDNLVTHGYSDWYMPSWDEYKALMEPNYSNIGLSASWYWTSSQCSQYGWDGAWTTTPGWSYNESYCVGGDCCLNKVYNPSSRTRCVRRW